MAILIKGRAVLVRLPVSAYRKCVWADISAVALSEMLENPKAGKTTA